MNRELLQQCLDMINAAIKSGDWKVDGACDPDSLIRRLEAELAKPDKFIDVCIDRKYVIRNYKSIITDIGIFCEFTLDEWNEHAKNIRELCEPEQEPVAWMEDSIELYVSDHLTHTHTIPLYTSPPRKEWVSITGNEVTEISLKHGTLTKDDFDFARAIESKLKEKNNAV